MSFFDGQDIGLVEESIEHYISNAPTDMNKFLVTADFDNVTIERIIGMSPLDIINKSFPHDDKNMMMTDSWKALIPPPKEKKKREAKPKADKPAKPRGKKGTISIAQEPTPVEISQ